MVTVRDSVEGRARNASRGFLATLVLGSQLACAAVPRALAPDPATARLTADEMLSVLASRFGPSEPGPRFAALRPRLARAGLVPSRVFDDASAWTARRGEEREVGFQGAPLPGERYAIEVAESPRAPVAPGEYRGLLRLERIRPGEFEWRLEESLALGRVPVLHLAAAGEALLRLADATPAGDARAALCASLPRTAASLGRVFSLERLSLVETPDGRQVDFEAVLHPDWLKKALPRYSEFLKRHVSTLQVSISLEDPPGSVFWRAALHDGRLSLSLKLLDGALLPLAGPARRLGDRCTVRAAFSARAGLFRYGLSDLVGEVALLRSPAPLGYRARFSREPSWRLPFLVEPFVRGTLRRPFEGEGATFGLTITDGNAPDAPTTVARDYSLAVKESWLVRWLGGNVSATVRDFRAGAEAESDRFTRETVSALREDVRALLATP